jgi:phospholipid transport system substrate-binding protein
MTSRWSFAVFAALSVVFFSVAKAPFAQAAPSEPAAFIEDLGHRAIALLQNKEASVAEQKQRFRALLHEGFATRRIGYFVIGKYRRTAPREKVDEFVDIFEDYIVELYSTQFRNYSGEKFKVVNTLKTNRDTVSIVRTHIFRPNGELAFKVDFQVYHRPDRATKIVDVKIEGVSMILAQRDEFTGFISQHGGEIQALINILKDRIVKLKSDTPQKDTDRSGKKSGDEDTDSPDRG